MAQDRQIDQHTSNREQVALEALRQHRAQSGYVPWNNADNERLRKLDRQQKQARQRQAQQAIDEKFFQRVKPVPRSYARLDEVIPQLAAKIEIVEAPVPEPTPLVWLDPELGRLAVGLKMTNEFRLWSIARQVYGQPGWTTRDQLFATFKGVGVTNSRRSFNRTLKDGAGVWWGLAGDRVYLRSYVKVAGWLTELAVETNPRLVATNIPGVRCVEVSVAGTIGDFKAQVYAGWLTYREDPTIARATLCTLFAVEADTLRNWEDRLGNTLEIIRNYGQTSLHPLKDNRIVDYIPSHSYSYVTLEGEIRIRWQQPNTYRTKYFREHPHKGQARKARFQSAKVAWFPPVETCAHAMPDAEKMPFDRSHREPKRYFASEESLQEKLKKLAKKGIDGISPATPRYIYRGENRYQHGIWELSLDGHANTTVGERLPIQQEYRWWAGYAARQRPARIG